MKLCAVIPAFNEKDKLYETVIQTNKFVENIIVVDDGSTDDSVAKVEKLNFTHIVKHKSNLGKGVALISGLKFAKNAGYDYAFTIDADLQHDPYLIPDFLEAQEKHDVDILIGNRLNSIKEMPLPRILSNFLTSRLLSIKTGEKILDSQSGYRLYRLEKIEKILPRFKGFEAESEMLVYAVRNNFKIGFVDVPTIYNDNKSKMKSFSAIIGFIKVLFI